MRRLRPMSSSVSRSNLSFHLHQCEQSAIDLCSRTDRSIFISTFITLETTFTQQLRSVFMFGGAQSKSQLFEHSANTQTRSAVYTSAAADGAGGNAGREAAVGRTHEPAVIPKPH